MGALMHREGAGLVCSHTSATRLLVWTVCALFASVLPRSLMAAQEVYSQTPWDREMGVGLAVDQEMTRVDLLSGTSICQVFTPAATRLERLDIVTKNRTDRTPGEIRLWRWEGSYAETVAGDPLWEDDLLFSGQDAPYLRNYFPAVDTEPGVQYMIECSRPSEAFYMAGVKEDVYKGGFALTNGKNRPDWDVYFRTFGPGDPTELTPRELPPIPDLAPTPPGAPARVTRDTYLDAINRYVQSSIAGWEAQPGRRAAEFLYYTGFLYRHAGQQHWAGRLAQWLDEALAYLVEHEDYGGNPWYVLQTGWGIIWYRGCPRWTDEVEATARELMLTAARRLLATPEQGAMNRAMWDVASSRLASELYPDAPEADQWRAFADEVWHHWADFDDTSEDSSHYNAVFLRFLLGHLMFTEQIAIFERPGMRQFMDRYRDLITPTGMMVAWGDSPGYGTDWGAFVAAFEAAASVTGDGAYRWAAHRLLDGHRRNILGDDPLLLCYEDLRSLPMAYLLADESIEPVEPELASAVYTMAYPRYVPKHERPAQGGRYYVLEDREVPWKMVQRDGDGEDAWWSLWGLLPLAGHGHADAPALLALFADATIFMHDSSYFHKQWLDHNLLYGVRVGGGRLGELPSETEVLAFDDRDAFCYADIAWSDYDGWGLPLRREVLMIKGLGWWVRDRTEATEAGEWFLGPLWQVERILDRGQTWFDIDYAVPMSFLWPSANGDGHLLVAFAPKEGATVDHADMSHRITEGKPYYSSAPWTIYQCEGPVQLGAGQNAVFSSLLIPLEAGEDAAAVGDGVRALVDEPGATVMRVRRGDTTWTMALNPERRELDLGAATSSARVVVVRGRDGEEVQVAEL